MKMFKCQLKNLSFPVRNNIMSSSKVIHSNQQNVFNIWKCVCCDNKRVTGQPANITSLRCETYTPHATNSNSNQKWQDYS